MVDYDVIVIGGGPSGSTCAKNLSLSGLRVLLIEKDPRGRYTPCGGGLSHLAYQLDKPPIKIIERKIISGLVVTYLGNTLYVGSPKEAGCTVYRTKYDEWLREEAAKAGADLLNSAVVHGLNITEEAKVKLVVKNQERILTSQVIVGAFGVEPSLYRIFNIKPPSCVEALQYEFSLPEKIIDERIGDSAEFYFDTKYAQHGYAWIFPKKDGLSVGLTCLPETLNKLANLDRFIREHKIASKKLKGTAHKFFEGRSLFISHIPISPVEKTYGNRFLLIGDAAGLADPLTFEGIYGALKSASLAAGTLKKAWETKNYGEDILIQYQISWLQELFDRDIKWAYRLSQLFYGHELSDQLLDTLIRSAQKDEEIETALKYIFNHSQPRKKVYDILSRKKLSLLRRLGLGRAVKLWSKLP